MSTMQRRRATFLLVQPDWMRMAKSPISCGTSCSRMVRVVTVPTVEPTRKDAPMARPSVKLWMKSAARLRYPDTLMSERRGRHQDEPGQTDW